MLEVSLLVLSLIWFVVFDRYVVALGKIAA